jgi:hypothetical protein
MICRIWHGWTTRENADAYERLLRTEIFHGIADRRIPGYRGIELLRRDETEPVEFVTLLLRFDEHSAHYEVRQPRAIP